ncbi:MAG: SNF2 family DNA or RNA helicase [Saprospiraceae bacterium]|jgi:SNF2 family DNA or RNA helicase
MPSGIVYGLSMHSILKVYVPGAFVVGIDRVGQLGYMERKGEEEVLQSYSFYDAEGPHKYALELCRALGDEAISAKFVKSKRLTLAKAIETPLIKSTILKYISKKVDAFLSYVVVHSFPLCFEVERKAVMESRRISLSDEFLEPRLHFTKSEDGIAYSLAIRSKNIQWYPSERDIFIVNDTPGWVVENMKLYRLQDVNGNKLKPFLKKRVVNIPNRIAHTYLEKFVKDIITKVPVKTEGFDIHTYNGDVKPELTFRKNFVSEEWMLELRLHYGEEMFQYRIPEKSRTLLKYEGDHGISFNVIERKEEVERKIIKQIELQGLSLDADKRFRLKDSSGEDAYELITWVRDHQESMNTSNIASSLPSVGDTPVTSDKPCIQISQVENNDWFDIHGVIRIGEHEVPFKELIDSIRNEERVFILPDETCFIIPLEWMSKYSGLARWAKEEGDGIKILRSQYTLMEEIKEEDSNSMAIYKAIEEDVAFEPSKLLKAELRPYQLVGAQWLVNHQVAELGCCLADDMGLGKTLQTLCALLYAKEQLEEPSQEDKGQLQLTLFETAMSAEIGPLKALIIMPASLIFNWYSEIKKFAPHLFVKRHMGPKRPKKSKELRQFDVVLTSYQTALRDESLLNEVEWSYIVLDESQYIKNHNSKIFRAIENLPSSYKLSLSGTPIENSLSDLWAQMQFINPEILGTYSFFKKHFQIPIEKYKDESLLEELKQITKPYILRRTKAEVLKDLPEKSEQVVFCEMTKHQGQLYEKEKSAARNLLLQSDVSDPQVRIQIFTSLLRLRQLSNHPVLYKNGYKHDSGKFEILIENLRTIKRAGHKALIFSSFTGHLDLVATQLKSENAHFVMLTGKTSQKQRQKSVEDFQAEGSNIQFFLISIKAGGTGLNLTAADYVYILDPWWNPFVENQAIARAHRIGLEHPLTVVRYITKDSIEEKIQLLQSRKRALSEDVLGDKTTPDWSKEEFGYLLE